MRLRKPQGKPQEALPLIESASVVADAARAISTEVIDFVRHSTERSIDHIGAMTRCRSPQDLVAAQTDAIRDNAELLMNSSRRIAEHCEMQLGWRTG
jgi:hypothetical protein